MPAINTESEEFLTPIEAGKLLAVSHETVRRLARARVLGYIRTTGGHYKIERTSVDRLRQLISHPEKI